ncbi:MAG TPA: AAA family ATPase, partial [Spirochaetota bacterium]|nr:AAA family ATPase [Spirochaetota bacterium]
MNITMQNELFNFENVNTPLSEKLRPNELSDFVGQSSVVGEGSLLRKMIENNNLTSFILWGPPGCGKTTIANIISNIPSIN